MTREELKELINEMAAEQIQDKLNYDRLIDETVLLNELNANPVDMKDLKKASEELQAIHKYYIGLLTAIIKVLDEVYSRVEKCKSEKEMEKLVLDLHNKYPKIVKEPQKWDGPSMKTSFQKYIRVCKKFNIKYSDEAMSEKKKIDAILQKNAEEVLKLGDGWVFFKKDTNYKDVKPNKLHDMIEDLEKIDRELAIDINNSCASLFKFGYNEFRYTLADAISCAKYLKLDMESTLRYKLVNTIFRTKEKK